MKKILIFLLLVFPLPTRAIETIPAGFSGSSRVIPEKLIIGQPARIYSTLSNFSNSDLIGKLQFYAHEQLISEVLLALPAQSTERYWFDTIITSSTERFSEKLTDIKKTELGKDPELVTLATSSLYITRDAIPAKNETSTPSSSTSSSSLITVSSPTSLSSTTPSEVTSTTSSTISDFLHSPLTQAATEKTKNIIQTLTSPLVNLLTEKQYSLEHELQASTSTEPIPVLNQAADAMEKKATFLKIPRERLPTFNHLYIWLIIAAKYILNTWWIMILIFLALFYNIWKLWRRIRQEED